MQKHNHALIILLLKKMSLSLTEKEKFDLLNISLMKRGLKKISRSTFFTIKRENPNVLISNKSAELNAKRRSRTNHLHLKDKCIKILSNREKILIDEMKSSIEIIVVDEGNSHKRRRTRTYFKYVINEIHSKSTVDPDLVGYELIQSTDDICREDGRATKPTIKALKSNDLEKYDQELCESKGLEWIRTDSGSHSKPAILVFRFTEGRFINFQGKLDRDSIRKKEGDFIDPRTLLDNQERWSWLKENLRRNNCKLLESTWLGSRKRVKYLCPKDHFNDPLLTNYFQSNNDFSCPICNEGGFDPSKPAWFYLMERDGEQQFGITNFKEQRLATHKRDGWNEIECTDRSHPGKEVEDTEKVLKYWLKNKVGLLPHRTERWNKNKKNIRSLKQLKKESDLQTSIF